MAGSLCPRHVPSRNRCISHLREPSYPKLIPNLREKTHMNWEQVQGQWKQLKGKLKMKWNKLTDDDLDFIAGQKDVLIGKIQERYGLKKEEAQRQVEEWNLTLGQ